MPVPAILDGEVWGANSEVYCVMLAYPSPAAGRIIEVRALWAMRYLNGVMQTVAFCPRNECALHARRHYASSCQIAALDWLFVIRFPPMQRSN